MFASTKRNETETICEVVGSMQRKTEAAGSTNEARRDRERKKSRGLDKSEITTRKQPIITFANNILHLRIQFVMGSFLLHLYSSPIAELKKSCFATGKGRDAWQKKGRRQ